MKKLLIGVAGKARQGKDSFAQGLTARGFVRGAFADALKQVTALVAKEPLHLFTSDDTKEEMCPSLGMTRRQALQKVGSGMRESLGEGVWVDRLLRTWVQADVDMVISDVRYENEARAIRALGGHIVQIERPGVQGLQGEAAQHASERPLPDDLVDFVVLNDRTVEHLQHRAVLLAQFMRNGKAAV